MANLYELLTPLLTCSTVPVEGTSDNTHPSNIQQPKETTKDDPSKKTKTLTKQLKTKKHPKKIKKDSTKNITKSKKNNKKNQKPVKITKNNFL